MVHDVCLYLPPSASQCVKHFEALIAVVVTQNPFFELSRWIGTLPGKTMVL